MISPDNLMAIAASGNVTAMRNALINAAKHIAAHSETFRPEWMNYQQGVLDGKAEASEQMIYRTEPTIDRLRGSLAETPA